MPRPKTSESTGHAGVLFSMCLALVLVVASVSAINLALPDLAVDLPATNTQLTWIADAYTVALAAAVLPLGAVGDRFGRRKVLVAGSAVFGVSSLIAAFAGSAGFLIGCRVGMGLGAAMIMPGTLSTITATSPPDRRERAVAIWAGFAAAGAVLGLLAAGLLLELWSWPSLFVASAAVAALAGVAALSLSPETRDPAPGPIDPAGALLLVLTIGPLVFGIIEGSDAGWFSGPTIAAFVISILAAVGWVWSSLRRDRPLLDPRLFRYAGFRAGVIVVIVQFMGVFGFFFVGLQYLQLILGSSPLVAAVALLPVAVVVLLLSPQGPGLVQRSSIKAVMAVGVGLSAVGFAALSFLNTDSGYLPFLGALIVVGAGFAISGTIGTSSITGSMPRRRQGVASAVNDTSRELGSALGVAVSGSIYATVYRGDLSSKVLGRLPGSARELTEGSAAGGLHVADALGAKGTTLATTVERAFMSGMSSAMVVVAIILGVALVGVLLDAPRGRDPKSEL